MTVNELAVQCGFDLITSPSPERNIDGVYIGDLLSWVMGRAREDNALITIMSNINVIAVATLADVSCVIFAEGVAPEQDIIDLATEKGVNLLRSNRPAYETALKISGVQK